MQPTSCILFTLIPTITRALTSINLSENILGPLGTKAIHQALEANTHQVRMARSVLSVMVSINKQTGTQKLEFIKDPPASCKALEEALAYNVRQNWHSRSGHQPAGVCKRVLRAPGTVFTGIIVYRHYSHLAHEESCRNRLLAAATTERRRLPT